MAKKIILLFVAFIAADAFILSCSLHSRAGSEGEDITVSEAYDFLKANKDNNNIIILDVRTPKEYNEGHLKGAVMINFYDADFNEQIGKLDAEKEYVIYCRVGIRSKKVFDMMKGMGFPKLHNVLGGIVAWLEKGLPLDLS